MPQVHETWNLNKLKLENSQQPSELFIRSSCDGHEGDKFIHQSQAARGTLCFKRVPESAPTVMCEGKQTVPRQYQDTQTVPRHTDSTKTVSRHTDSTKTHRQYQDSTKTHRQYQDTQTVPRHTDSTKTVPRHTDSTKTVSYTHLTLPTSSEV